MNRLFGMLMLLFGLGTIVHIGLSVHDGLDMIIGMTVASIAAISGGMLFVFFV